jgi:hypothetical protein
MATPHRPAARYPYRAVGELENIIARQIAVHAELTELRRAATDPRTKAYLHAQEQQARTVLDWLRELRTEMRAGPRD